ncbi:MAG: hypothetical protein JST26_17815 [Bacteroidetes bacterium]|nr:hypothetical protein [Bacteroidota bacterium]
MKHALLLVFYFTGIIFLQAQTSPPTITLGGTSYYVYPFRIDQSADDIPPCALKLPDGRYVAYRPYSFRELKHSFKEELIVKDSSLISVVFEIANNVPQKTAYFYADKRFRPGAKASALGHWTIKGEYLNGLKEGTWVNRQYGSEVTTHYKNGLKHGPVSAKKHKSGVPEGTYVYGRQAGRFYEYNYKGRLCKVIYHDTLEQRDTIMVFYKDRMTDIYDDVKETKHRKQDIWYFFYHNHAYTYSGRINGYSSFKRSYDADGKLTTSIAFTNDSTFQFDSLLAYNTWVYAKTIPCTSPSEKGRCYMITERPVHPDKDEAFETRNFYCNKELMKVMRFYRNEKNPQLTDTSYSVYYVTDTLRNPWIPQLHREGWFRSQKTYSENYIPALQYSYYTMRKYRSPHWQKIANIDTAKGVVYFSDTIDSKNVTILSHVSIQKKTIPAKTELPFRRELYEPIVEYKAAIRLGFQTTEFGLLYRQSRGLSSVYAPEFILYNKTPYTGKLFFDDRYRTKEKHHIVYLDNSAGSGNLAHEARGNYLNGLKDGTWEFTEPARQVHARSDFYKTFMSHHSINYYYKADFREGLRNGPFYAYDTYIDQTYNKRGKDIYTYYKYLSYTANFVNDTLEGPMTVYDHTGKVSARANYHKGLLDGPCTRYSDSLLVYSATFRNGLLQGELKTYRPNAKHLLAVKAEFTNNVLNGLLEMYSGNKWLEIKADSGRMLYKKMFYDNGNLKEEITMDAGSRFILNATVVSSDNFMEYCHATRYNPTEIEETKETKKRLREISLQDSLNELLFDAAYVSYFDNGNVYCKGLIKQFKPVGKWTFYDVNGALIHEIQFRDSTFHIAGDTILRQSLGILTGYYYNGKPRCKAFVKAIDVSFDCNTKTDRSAFETILIDNYDFYDKVQCHNGTGTVKQYTENGLLVASGEMKDYSKTGLWKYYDPNQKLKSMGMYVNGLREGVWYEGDLEGLNYEDAACFDKNNAYELKEFYRNQKALEISKLIYKKGRLMQSDVQSINMNRE